MSLTLLYGGGRGPAVVWIVSSPFGGYSKTSSNAIGSTMANMETSEQRDTPFRFEGLPPELRDMVYGFAQRAYDVSQ